MTDKRVEVLLRELRDAANAGVAFVGANTRDEFLADELLQNAVAMTLVRVGEAAVKITQSAPLFVEQRPELRWASMRGLRNVLAHAYHEVDFVILWRVVRDHLPPLIAHLDAILRPPER